MEIKSVENVKVLSETEIEKLVESDQTLFEEMKMMEKEGYELESVKITTSVVNSFDASAMMNQKFNIGKRSNTDYMVQIRDHEYKQGTKKEKIYIEDYCNTIADLDKYIQVGIGVVTDYLWIPLTYFGISTSFAADVLSTGYVESTEDSTYYSRTVWVYDASNRKYVLGAGAEKKL